MPQAVTNQTIIKFIETTEAERVAINTAVQLINKRKEEFEHSAEAKAIQAEDEEITKRTKEYNNNIRNLKVLMDEEYGYGNWQNLDVKDFSFFTRAELEADPEWKKKHYILANPDIREKVEVDDIKIIETGEQANG